MSKVLILVYNCFILAFDLTRMSEEKNTKTTDVFAPEFIKKMEDILSTEKAKLEKELLQFSKNNSDASNGAESGFPNYGDEEDDNVREVADYAVNKTLQISLEKKLRDVVSSLNRIKENTYGICKYTGKPIEEKRLLARPTSSSSVNAKKVLTHEA